MYILQFSPPPRQCTDYLSFPIIFEPIRQFVGYKKPRRAFRGKESSPGRKCEEFFYFLPLMRMEMPM